MGYDSDAEIKSIMKEIERRTRIEGTKIRLKCFPPGSRDDQLPWIRGGLCFGQIDLLYGACDAVWYRLSHEPWYDPINKKFSALNETPVVAVEGTLALERRSSGSAQYQRFSHALGAILGGIFGVYYLRKSITVSKMRYDLPKAALNASQVHGIPYLVTNEIEDIEDLVRSVKKEDSDEQKEVIARIKWTMEEYYRENCPSEYVNNIDNYCKGRSIAKSDGNNYIKILSTNMANLTTAQKRGGHILLGEYLVAKYMLNTTRFDNKVWVLLPRLTRRDIDALNASDKKEWKLVWSDSGGHVITIEDLDGVDPILSRKVADIRDKPLDRSSPYYSEWEKIVQMLMQQINNRKIWVKQSFKLSVPRRSSGKNASLNRFLNR